MNKNAQPPTRGFTIDNRTKWSSADLRRIIAEVVRRQGGPTTRAGKPRGFLVEVVTGGYSGWAYIGGSIMRVRLPPLPVKTLPIIRLAGEGQPIQRVRAWRMGRRRIVTSETPPLPDPCYFASIVAHELAHLRGLKGERDMRSSKWLSHGKAHEAYAWARDFPIRPEAKKTKIRPAGAELAERKREAAAAKVTEWERKKKLAETKLRAWRQKVRYHEKRAAALRSSK